MDGSLERVSPCAWVPCTLLFGYLCVWVVVVIMKEAGQGRHMDGSLERVSPCAQVPCTLLFWWLRVWVVVVAMKAGDER